jgi:type IV secretion system protein VirB2
MSLRPALLVNSLRLQHIRTLNQARRVRLSQGLLATLLTSAAPIALAQGFTRINTTVTNVNAILVTISIAVVTMAIIWAGFKMIFSGARLADVANVLIGGTLVGGAAAFAAFIVA